MKTQLHRTYLIPLFATLLFIIPPAVFAYDTITIASFNPRIFGTTKAEKPAILQEIASIIRRFDIVAVQKIRDKSETAPKELLTAVNADGSYHYDMLIGPRLGRTSSKEQYAFFYRTSSVVPIGSTTIWQDTSDKFEREPFFAMLMTAQSNTYDRMAETISTQEDWTGIWNVLRFDEDPSFEAKGLKALDNSDHYPAWASFYVDRDTD